MTYAKQIVRACVPRQVRSWLRSPTKSLEWVVDEIKHTLGLSQTIEIRSGWSLRCHPGAYGFAYWAQQEDPEQVAEFDGFISRCRSGMALFDIGAHFGLFSFAALHYGGTSARTIAVDPSPTAMRIMKIQAELNGMSDRLCAVQAAVGESGKWQDMVTVGVHSGGYLIAASEDYTSREITRTPSTTLDQLARDFKLLPTHIKIDVEGCEAQVLRGGSGILSADHAPLLFLELHNEIIRERHGDPAETISLLRQFGYETFGVDGVAVDAGTILNRRLVRVIAKKRSV